MSNQVTNPWYNKFKYLVPLLAIIIVMAIGYHAKYLAFSTDYRAFFGKDNPQLINFEALQNVYGKDDNILFMIEKKNNADIFDKKTLTAVKFLTDESWQMPFSTRVDSISNYQHTESEADDLLVADLVEFPEELNEEKISKVKKVSLNEPLLVNRLVSGDGKVTAVNVTLEMPGKTLTEVPEVVQWSRDLREKFKNKYPDYNIYLTGLTMLNNAFAEASQKDMACLNPIMFALILFLIFFLSRSISGTIATVLVIFLSIISAMGFAGLLRVQLTPVSMTTITVVMTLAVADSIHILVSFREYLNKGITKVEAVAKAMRSNILAVFITSVTTAIGFLSLNFSDAPPYHDYGNMTAFGVMMAFSLSVTLLPALLCILPSKAKLVKEGDMSWVDKIASVVISKRKPIVFASVIGFIIISFGFNKITLNDEFVNYFDESIEFRKDTDVVMEKLTGIYNLSFPLETELEGGVSNPKYIAKLEEFSNWLRDQADVMHVNTLSDIFKRLNKNMHSDNPEYYKIPDNSELAAQYLLLYKMSLPYGLDLNNTLNLDETASKLLATLGNTSSVRLRELEAQANQWLVENAQGVFKAKATSPSVMFSHISERNISSMITGTIVSTLIITFIMILSLKSLRYGLISLIPNLVPVLLTFGTWGYLVGKVDMGVATIAGLTLGIVVDDTVHFMIKYLRGRRELHDSPEQAVHYAFHNVGKALIMTSIILVTGFIVMSFSNFTMNWSMGVMSAMTIVFALLTDLVFLPAFLLSTEKKQ